MADKTLLTALLNRRLFCSKKKKKKLRKINENRESLKFQIDANFNGIFVGLIFRTNVHASIHTNLPNKWIDLLKYRTRNCSKINREHKFDTFSDRLFCFTPCNSIP